MCYILASKDLESSAVSDRNDVSAVLDRFDVRRRLTEG